MAKPINGALMFKALKDKGCIIMACNTRIIPGITKGIFRAAKETDSALIIELAKSECDLKGGYTGLTPEEFSKRTCRIADEVGFDAWALHADHTAVKKGTEEELADVKKLLASCIAAGYTSFAIDASHLFNFEGKTTEEELKDNVRCTIILSKFIRENYWKKNGNEHFGLEVEVGEIGRKCAEGMILTKPEEASAFIRSLNKNSIYPHVIAIANGSTHGNIYDEKGNLIEQVSIDIARTKEVAQELRKMKSDVRIAQHGITGTPLNLIKEKFPHGDIIKGNVATFWQNLFWDVVSRKKPLLFKEAFEWVINNYREEAAKKGVKREEQIFGEYGKFAAKQFFDKIDALDEETIKVIEDKTYCEALRFFDAFKAKGSAQIVRDYVKKLG